MSEKSLVDSVLEIADEQADEIMAAKIKVFEDEIGVINNPGIKSFVRAVLKMIEPFWVSPASLVKDTHPPDEYGPEGMVIHTKRVFRIVGLLMTTIQFSSEEVDCLFAAALLHDVTKAAWADVDDKVVFHDQMHPYTVDNIVDMCIQYDEKNNVNPPQDNTLEIEKPHLELILKLIRHSHGVFSPIPETIPSTQLLNLLHTADFLASSLHVIIDGGEVNNERWI